MYYASISCCIDVMCLLLSPVFAVSIINPLELIRTNMQSKPLSYAELVSCIRTAVEVDGFVSLWRGLGPTLLRDVPFSGQLHYSSKCSHH